MIPAIVFILTLLGILCVAAGLVWLIIEVPARRNRWTRLR